MSPSRNDEVDLSIIIVSWNTKNLLKNCLNSIEQTVSGIRYEIIVVDNASADGTVEMLEEEFPSVIKIINKENRGFGAANNQAFRIMKSRYALLLNTDTVLTNGAVKKLWDFCEVHERAGMVCGQLLNADGSKQNSVASFPGLLTLAINTPLLEYLLPRRYPSKRYKHTAPVEVDSAIGACMMISRKALEETGFFDERYFFFFEETDLALTMRKKGWKIYHLPDAFIYHLQGRSVGQNVKSRIEFYRSRYQFLHKWHSPGYVYVARGIISFRLLINDLSYLIFNIVTLGLSKKARQKGAVYSALVRWHFQKDR